MKRKKKLMALFLVIASFASLAMMTVHADPPPHPYVYAYLRLNMTSAVSGTVYRTNTHYGGYNQSNSAHRVYLSAHYSDGSGWKKDKELLVGIGATVGDSPTSTRSTCCLLYTADAYKRQPRRSTEEGISRGRSTSRWMNCANGCLSWNAVNQSM